MCRSGIYAARGAMHDLDSLANVVRAVDEPAAAKLDAFSRALGPYLALCDECPFMAYGREHPVGLTAQNGSPTE